MKSYLPRLMVPLSVSLFVLVACGLTVALQHDRASAQTTAATCNVVMAIDRSGSVGQDPKNLGTMQGQISSLFNQDALADPNIKLKEGLTINLGFWTFSSYVAPSSTTNYDSPYMNFVNVRDASAQANFNAAFSQVVVGGGTDYEQGFAYHGYALSSQTMNPNADIQRLAKSMDVLVFMTDGVPNTPANITQNGDNNPTAINAARQALNSLKTFNSQLITQAVMVGPDTDSAALDYIINGYGNPNNIDSGARSNKNHPGPNISYIDANYGNLKDTIEPIIRQRCEEINNITPGDSYSLKPTVTSNDTVGAGTATATFNYNVNSTLPSGSTTNASSSWKIEKVVVPKGQSTSGLMFGQNPNCGYDAQTPNSSVSYCDGVAGCTQLAAFIGGSGGGRSCSDVASGTTAFPHGDTSLNQYAGGAVTATIDSSYPIGTKLCFVLIVHEPTQNSSPVDRASRAACLTIGKRPSVQIIGGDLRVGRYFSTDSAPTNQNGQADPAEITTSVTAKSDGKSYGSWVEYAAMAPGAITGFGSLSGLSGGYPSAQPDAQQFWSKLTFSNVQNQFGFYTEANNGQGTIPDYASTILASRGVVSDLSAANTLSLRSGSNASGIYQKTSGDITITDSTLGKNETVILNVPNGTVTIAGNIAYDDGPYTNIAEIPQLVIIAKTIAIDPSVANVDAWLIANSASDGTVTTCDDPGALSINTCDQQLTINGPVMAHHLNLRRTGGSDAGAESADPAEIINLSGTTYLWAQSDGQSDVRAQTTLTTELPPYF